MAAYAAVISLKHTINDLLNSSRISLVSSTREILESSYNEATSLQQVLERLNDSSSSRSKSSHERLDGLEGQIRDFAHKQEDVLEFHELNSDKDDEQVLMRQEITSFGEAAKKMEKDYIQELSRDDNDDDDDDDDEAVLSRFDFGVEMVGRSSDFTMIRRILLKRTRPDDLWFYALFGEEGTGRTVAANTIFEDARNGRSRKQIFDCWAWVRMKSWTKHELKEILIRIIAQVDNLAAEADYELLVSQEDEKLSKHLYKLLKNRRYMIVLDDVDDVELVNYLKTMSFPDQSNGSVVFLTTASNEVARLADTTFRFVLAPSYFEEYMWSVTRDWVLNFESISAEMEVAGKKIIQNCRCLVISFVKAFLFLLSSDTTVEEWSKIAADEQNPIFMVADEISEVRQIKREMQYCNRKIDEMISPLVVFSDVEVVKMKMHPERFFSRMQIISFFGMAGIGKTTFVRKIFKDKLVLSHFDRRVWITLGPNYQKEDILLDILAQLYPHIHMKGDEKLIENLCQELSSKRCLVVLDDLWSKEPLLHLRNLFPYIRGTTLVTTRLVSVAKFGRDDIVSEMHLLEKEESWCLLRQKVFGEGLCPPELEKVGRKIAEKCDGLPLLILTVADELLKVETSQEYWNNVASGKEKSVFKNAHYQISESLLPSYRNLPQHQKPCFLYMGVFRENFEIPAFDLANLCISEGFFNPILFQMEEESFAECLYELFDRSLVMVQRNVSGTQIKTCRLHSVFWHLSNGQAVKNKFFHAMTSYDDCSMESIKSQRRLCIRNSILLGMKYVQMSMASNTSAHSLLCVSPLHQYPVPVNFDFRLLRVMDAITIRLYEFPVDVVRLVHLRYLGLTCNGKLPTSISNLWKLQYLIVKRFMDIKSSEKYSSELPMEIWDMKELKYLQIMGGCLPNHRCGTTGLLKLITLLDVSAQSCRKKVLKGIPNLLRLRIRIELAPDDDEGNSKSFRCLNNIHHLRELESLKCVVVNPQIRYSKAFATPAPVSMFPSSLKKLSLSGLGYPWEHTSIIGKLKNLEVLKLKCYAFEGAKWEMDYTSQFEKLKFLSVEDTNLVHWKLNWVIAKNLEHLCIKHCYKLQELPTALPVYVLKNVEIVDCSPLTVTWAKQMGEMNRACEVSVHDSWFANIPTKNDSETHL